MHFDNAFFFFLVLIRGKIIHNIDVEPKGINKLHGSKQN